MDHLSPEESIESEIPSKFRNYVINSREVLQRKFQTSVPIPFVITKDGNLIFVFQHCEAIEFKFTDLIDVQMGWFYFNITFLGLFVNPLLKIKHENTATKCALLPSVSCSNKTCYTAVSDDWLTLDKSGRFEVCSNLNLDIKYPIN